MEFVILAIYFRCWVEKCPMSASDQGGTRTDNPCITDFLLNQVKYFQHDLQVNLMVFLYNPLDI